MLRRTFQASFSRRLAVCGKPSSHQAGFENERRPSSKQLDICIRNGGHDDNVLRPRHSIFDSFDRHDKLFAQLLDQYNAQTDVLSWWRPRKRQDER